MWRAVCVAVAMSLLVGAGPARAEEVVVLWRGGNVLQPDSLDVDWTDGSCWVGDIDLVHLASDHSELWRSTSFSWATAPQVNQRDRTLWVIDHLHFQIVHLTPEHVELWRSPAEWAIPLEIAVNETDGTVWVTDAGYRDTDGASHAQLTHLAADGTELWSGDGFAYPASVSADPRDNSVWVADEFDHSIVHLTPDGSEIRRVRDNLDWPLHLEVDPVDGTVWVAEDQRVWHYSAEGVLLSKTVGFACASHLSVNPADGSCWVADSGQPSRLVHLSQGGTELWSSSGFTLLAEAVASPADGTVWAADMYGDLPITHLQIVGYQAPIFRDVPAGFWAYDQIKACYEAGIVSGYADRTYRPTSPVTRDQMAVYVSRALAGGDAQVPAGPVTPSFPDVPASYWAYKYVEYAKAQGVVGGYADGNYRPTAPVDRAQMAVFVARAMAGGDSNVPPGPATAFFADVPTDFWAFKYVEYIHSGDVTGGYPDGTYRPTVGVTRDQMAVYVQRASNLPM